MKDIVMLVTLTLGILCVVTVAESSTAEESFSPLVFSTLIGGEESDIGYSMIKVKWDYLLGQDNAITSKDGASMGYQLPVRAAFSRLRHGQKAKEIEKVMIQRQG